MAPDQNIDGFASLGADVNKVQTASEETKPGAATTKLSELTLEMPDEDIVKLTEQWEKAWNESPAKQDWEKAAEENEKYWLGKHHNLPVLDDSKPIMDNVIFEGTETYLPQATRRNPEPLVTLDATEESTPEKEKYVEKVKSRLADLADKNKLRLKLKKGARHWLIFLLGVAKFGWDLDKDLPIVRIVRPKKIILDPEATIDEDGYTGGRIGEHRKMEASKILAIIGEEDEKNAEAVKKIKETVDNKLGTDIKFIEWWTPEYMCWKLDKTILFKRKNPLWNYEQEGQATNDEFGNPVKAEPVKAINHFPVPKMPYEFLSIFNLGDQPMDKTSLIGQNISNQDQINKRNGQIDKNADDMNNGIVVSLARSGLTQTQAKGVTQALRKGGVVVIPDGVPREAIDRYPAPGLPADIYNDLADKRARLRDIFGVKGSSQAGLEGEETVRGKIISRTLDTDRIGGGVTEYLEQWADDWYNWFVQLLYVFDPGFQFVAGKVPPKILVSVKEGSLLPKDSTSLANQALELAKINRISNIDLYKKLEYPNAEELAANVWLEENAPHLLFKDNPLVQEAIAMQQQAAQAKAQEEAAAMDAKHGKEMEKMEAKQGGDLKREIVKGDMRAGGSILSEVPQEETVQQV